MNFWRQTTHIMSYFKEENFRGDKRLPSNFMEGFMEVSTAAAGGHWSILCLTSERVMLTHLGTGPELEKQGALARSHPYVNKLSRVYQIKALQFLLFPTP